MPGEETFEIKLPASDTRVAVQVVRSSRSRRMILRVAANGEITVSVPRFFSGNALEEARLFALKNLDWLDARLAKVAERKRENIAMTLTDYLRQHPEISVGNSVKKIVIGEAPLSSFYVLQEGSDVVPVMLCGENPDAELKYVCREIAQKILPPRVRELAAQHGVSVGKVSVRAQKSRWGSCTASGDISLNYVTIFLPPEIRDHVILHELAHRLHMNHSGRFWGLLNSWDAQTARHDDALTRTWGKILMHF